MDATRHNVTREALLLADENASAARTAEDLEHGGNWYLAGEHYLDLVRKTAPTDIEERSKILARAGACFDIAGQPRAAARAYFDSASNLYNAKVRMQTAGELYNRAALLFRQIGEFFQAGDSWRRAGQAFSELPPGTVTSTDNLQPVAAVAGNFTIAGDCYVAGGDAFCLAGDNAKWACRAYWEGGRAHDRQGYGYPAFEAYRKALLAGIRFYGTHEPDELRRYLPLTEVERIEKLDPLRVLEDAANRSNRDHQRGNSGTLTPTWVEITTHRQMAATFHEFNQACISAGNLREASHYRAATKERQRRIHVCSHRLGVAFLYWLWRNTSGYGESLSRWAASCALVLCTFALLYAGLDAIAPRSSWFDPLYFSVVTFTTLGYGDIQPLGLVGKIIAAAESTAGLIMLGSLLTFIGNRTQHW